MVDSACEGGIMNKLPKNTWWIMGELASNSHQWRYIDRHVKNKEAQASGLYHVDQSTAISSQIEALTKKIEMFMASQAQQISSVHTPPPQPPVTSSCNLCKSVSHTEDSCLVGAHFR